jgi:hypothetical protein
MADSLSARYAELLSGSYDCMDRMVLNGYFRLGHSPGGFRTWWRALTDSEQGLDNAHLMRMAGRFSRRLHAYAKANAIPVLHCQSGQRKHELAEDYLAKNPIHQGLFLIAVGRAPAPVWEVRANGHIQAKKSRPSVNHYSFHILDPDWGHLTIKLSGHPPFPAQIILNGHEWVACQAGKAAIAFKKESNCFTEISDAAGLAQIADALSAPAAIGRLDQVCERWIYSSCLCFGLDLEEQKKSGFHYPYSLYQLELSRNLIFAVGGQMEQLFEALIERSRRPLSLETIKTILGSRSRPKRRKAQNHSGRWEVSLERPLYNLTVLRLRCGKLVLKTYTKGERVLRTEVVVHNSRQLRCGRALEKLPQILLKVQAILERFLQALSCIDQCFIADDLLEQLPQPAWLAKTRVGGIDLNKARMRWVLDAVMAFSAWSGGFSAAQLAAEVQLLSKDQSDYGLRRAAYDLKKLRAKKLVERIGQSRRYQSTPEGLKAIVALRVLRTKVLTPLLAAAQGRVPSRGAQNSTPIDQHYQILRTTMQAVFNELGLAA